jgi:hypothetical protein
LDELKSCSAAHEQQKIRKVGSPGQQLSSDQFIHGIVAADILANSQEIALRIEEGGRVKTSCPLKDGLLFADKTGGLHEKFHRMLRLRGIKANL